MEGKNTTQLLAIPKGTFENFASGLVEKFNSCHETQLSMPTTPEHFGNYNAIFGASNGAQKRVNYESSVVDDLVTQINDKINDVATQLPSGRSAFGGSSTQWITTSGSEGFVVDLNNLKYDLIQGANDIITANIDWGAIASSAVIPFAICAGIGVASSFLPGAIRKLYLKKKIKDCSKNHADDYCEEPWLQLK